jgi:hypothetical protein
MSEHKKDVRVIPIDGPCSKQAQFKNNKPSERERESERDSSVIGKKPLSHTTTTTMMDHT